MEAEAKAPSMRHAHPSAGVCGGPNSAAAGSAAAAASSTSVAAAAAPSSSAERARVLAWVRQYPHGGFVCDRLEVWAPPASRESASVECQLAVVHSVPWGALHLRVVRFDEQGRAHATMDQPLAALKQLQLTHDNCLSAILMPHTPPVQTQPSAGANPPARRGSKTTFSLRAYDCSNNAAAQTRHAAAFRSWSERLLRIWRDVTKPDFSRMHPTFKTAPTMDAVRAMCEGRLQSAAAAAPGGRAAAKAEQQQQQQASTARRNSAPGTDLAAAAAATSSSTAATASTAAMLVPADSAAAAAAAAARSSSLSALDALLQKYPSGESPSATAPVAAAAAAAGSLGVVVSLLEQEPLLSSSPTPSPSSSSSASSKRRSRSKSKHRTSDEPSTPAESEARVSKRASKRARKIGSSPDNCIVIGDTSEEDEEMEEQLELNTAAAAAAVAADPTTPTAVGASAAVAPSLVLAPAVPASATPAIASAAAVASPTPAPPSAALVAAITAAYDIDGPRAAALDEELRSYRESRGSAGMQLRAAREALAELQGRHAALQDAHAADLARLDRQVAHALDLQDRLAGELALELSRKQALGLRELQVHSNMLAMVTRDLNQARTETSEARLELSRVSNAAEEDRRNHAGALRALQSDLDAARAEVIHQARAIEGQRAATLALQQAHAQTISAQERARAQLEELAQQRGALLEARAAKTASGSHALAELLQHVKSVGANAAQNSSSTAVAASPSSATAASASSSSALLLSSSPNWSSSARCDPSFELCVRLWSDWCLLFGSSVSSSQAALDSLSRSHVEARAKFVEHREVLKAQVEKLEAALGVALGQAEEHTEKRQDAERQIAIQREHAERERENHRELIARMERDNTVLETQLDALRASEAAANAAKADAAQEAQTALASQVAIKAAAALAARSHQQVLVRVKTEVLDAGEQAVLAAQITRKTRSQLEVEQQRVQASETQVVALTLANEELVRAAAEAAAATPTDTFCCRICMDGPPQIVFLPCNHLLCCAGCAKQLTQCPTCTRKIRTRLHVYVS